MNKKNDISINQLTRALFYETQFRNALVSDAITYFDANLTKNSIENDFFFKDDKGDFISVTKYIDLEVPCSFSDYIENWSRKMILDISKKNIPYIDCLREHLITQFNDGNREFTVNYWIETPDGKKVYLNHIFLLIKNENGDICAFSVIKNYTDIALIDEKTQISQIEKYAYVDPITNGYNYAKFKEQLRKNNTPGVIISVDIHSFKIVNSISGITKGDEVIKKIWNIIFEQLETEHKELAAHINADHFIIYLPIFDRKEIVQRIKNITFALNFISSELDIPVLRPYFGIAFWDKSKRIEYSYSESVIAKKKARDLPDVNYSFFEMQDTQKIVEEKTIVDSFETALARKDFKIFYQPKYSPTTRRLVGAEALIRWQKEDGSLMSPGSFIPIYEQNGMIRILDEYVFRNVCQQQKNWLKEGKSIVPVSVNLSRASLYFKNVVNQYSHIAEEVGIDKKYVPIEITETAAITSNEIKNIAESFFEAGFSIHMDDFGSGYSSLASLNIMHIEALKIDKSLIDYIGNFGGNRLIEHTITLAKELGISVTAEGVETENQVVFLHDIGCDNIQGFFFSKPVPSLDFEKLMEIDSGVQKNPYEDSILQHISTFKRSILKRPLYSFVANLTKNTFSEGIGRNNWQQDMNLSDNNYQNAIEKVTNDFVLPEYKDAFKNIMNRNDLIASYKGLEESRLFEYKQKYQDREVYFRLLIHLFKIPETSDLWLYFNSTEID